MLGAVPAAIGQRCAIARLTHYPCPGCGLTRAAVLMRHGDIVGSLTMQPLLVPLLAAHSALAVVTIHATWGRGTPWDVWHTPWGRKVVWFVGVTYAAMVVLWILRALGLFGGPVPV
jgi:hypothetical protein